MVKFRTTAIRFPIRAVVRDKRSGAAIHATVRRLSPADLQQWAGWEYGTDDRDKSWQWDQILKGAQRSRSLIECYGLFLGDELHGLMSIDLAGHAVHDGRTLIIDYLATNPANRRGPDGVKDIGRVLVGLALYRSKQLGWGGHLWLESLAGAEAFYERIGFSKLRGRSKEGNSMFQLGAPEADRLWQDFRDAKVLSLAE